MRGDGARARGGQSLSTGGSDTRYTGPGDGVIVGTLRGRARFDWVVAWELGS